MEFKGAFATGGSHGAKRFDRRIETRAYRAHDVRLRARRKKPTGFSVDHKLRNAGHVGAQNRARQQHRLDQDDRQSFGKARQDQRARGEDFPSDVGSRGPAGDRHDAGQAPFRDQPLDRFAMLAVADQHQFEPAPLLAQRGDGLHQQNLPLLFAQSPDAYQTYGIRRYDRIGFGEGRIDPTANEFDLGPILRRRDAEDLGADIGAYHDHEFGSSHLLRQVIERGFVIL